MVSDSLAEEISQKITAAKELYFSLILLVAPAGSGKTLVLREVATRNYAPLINVNLELSRRLLELTARKRALALPRLLQEICSQAAEEFNSDLCLLDNLEMLFDPALQQDPLRLLKKISRRYTLIAAWPGEISSPTSPTSGHLLTYAVPEHPEYRRYHVDDILLVPIIKTA